MSLWQKEHRPFSDLAASRLDFKTHATIPSATLVRETFVYSSIEKTLPMEDDMVWHLNSQSDIIT